jgi:hypothetical protein
MKNIFLLTLVLAVTTFSNAQLNVVWGNFVKAKGNIVSVLPLEGSAFYTWSINNSVLLQPAAYIGEDKEIGFWHGAPDPGITYLSRYADFALASTGQIKARIGKENAQVETVLTVKGEPVVFLSAKDGKERILYMQKYSAACTPAGEPLELMRYTASEGMKKGSFNVTSSLNKRFIAVEYGIPGSKEGRQKLGYKVFSAAFETVSEGKYELPYAADMSDIGIRYLSETGDYFITAKVYEDEQKGVLYAANKPMIDYNVKHRDNCVLEKMILIHVAPDRTKEYELNLAGRKLFDIHLNSDNKRIMTLTGIYGERKDPGVKGVFYYALDFEKHEIVSQGVQDFQQYFNEELAEAEGEEEADTLADIPKNGDKKKKDPKLFNYTIREIMTEADGSTIGLLEQYSVTTMGASVGRTMTGGGVGGMGTMTTSVTPNITYAYRDLIVYKMNPDGTFAWVSKIPKYQVSLDDYGILGSIARYVTADKLTLFFNDNLKSYDEAGNWNGQTRNVGKRKKTNTIAKVEVNLNDGTMTRICFFDRKETEAFAIPKLFQSNYETGQMLFTLRKGSEEKFGLITFE